MQCDCPVQCLGQMDIIFVRVHQHLTESALTSLSVSESVYALFLRGLSPVPYSQRKF